MKMFTKIIFLLLKLKIPGKENNKSELRKKI